MLGWHVSVHRKASRRSRPATTRSPRGDRLAVWQADAVGLSWLDVLSPDDCVRLATNGGFPVLYTAKASSVIPALRSGPPAARSEWQVGPGEVVDPSKWVGRTVIDDAAIDECDPEEWLVIEAWDES